MKRLRIDFSSDEDAFRCAMYGALGFSTEFIMAKTKLTAGQVGYRLKKAQVSRKDYRDGRSTFAGIVLQESEERIAQQLKKHLEIKMKRRQKAA